MLRLRRDKARKRERIKGRLLIAREIGDDDMKFSELEAIVKDDIPKVDKKSILRRLKRVLGQINTIIPGLLRTKTAVDFTAAETDYTVSGQIPSVAHCPDPLQNEIRIVTTTGGDYTEKELWQYVNRVWVKITLIDGDKILLTQDLIGGAIEFFMKYIYEWDADESNWISKTYITDGFNYLAGKLTLHKDIKQTFTVLMDSLPWTRKTAGYVQNNYGEKVYWFSQYNELIFAEKAIASVTKKIEISGLYKIPIPTTTTADTLIDIPEDWEEGIVAGIIYYFAVLGKHAGMEKDEISAIRSIYQPQFDRMMRTIGDLELNRHPVEEIDQGFTGYK